MREGVYFQCRVAVGAISQLAARHFLRIASNEEMVVC